MHAMYMKRAVTEVAGAGTDCGAKLSITKIHDKLGQHVNEDMAKKTAKKAAKKTAKKAAKKKK